MRGVILLKRKKREPRPNSEFFFFFFLKKFHVSASPVILAAMCLGWLGNPVGFLVLAVKPGLRQHPSSAFGAAMTVSFALTTVGYAGAAWSVGRAALLAL